MDMEIPLTVRVIIQNSMEEFTDLLSSKDITEGQINICRDIRSRGKNKVRTAFFKCLVYQHLKLGHFQTVSDPFRLKGIAQW